MMVWKLPSLEFYVGLLRLILGEIAVVGGVCIYLNYHKQDKKVIKMIKLKNVLWLVLFVILINIAVTFILSVTVWEIPSKGFLLAMLRSTLASVIAVVLGYGAYNFWFFKIKNKGE